MIARLQMSLGLRGVQSQVWPGLRSPVAFGIVEAKVNRLGQNSKRSPA